MENSVLVVAAHPDDEVLGCGGAIAKHTMKGDRVHVLIMAEGLTSRMAKRDRARAARALKSLHASAKKANDILGVRSLKIEKLPDNRMDQIDLIEVVKIVEKMISFAKPNIIYTHNFSDLNIDHRITSEAVVTACRPGIYPNLHTILFFEVPSSTEWQAPSRGNVFSPNWYVDISDTLEIKLKALSAYSSEMRPWPHPRSLQAVENLAKWRGASMVRNAAEAFVLGRRIEY